MSPRDSQEAARRIISISEAAVPVKQRYWSACSEENKVSIEALLVDDGSAFRCRKDGTFRLRKAKTGLDDRVHIVLSVPTHKSAIPGPCKASVD